MKKAIAAQRSAQRGAQGKRKVARQARNRKKLKAKYPQNARIPDVVMPHLEADQVQTHEE